MKSKPVAQRRFRVFYGIARRYWDDARHSSLDWVSRRECFRHAARRVGFDLEAFDRLYERCFDPCVEPNGEMLSFNEMLSCELDARNEQSNSCAGTARS